MIFRGFLALPLLTQETNQSTNTKRRCQGIGLWGRREREKGTVLSCQVCGCPVLTLLLDPTYSLISTAPRPHSSLTSANLHFLGAKGKTFGFIGHRQQSGPPECSLVSNSPSDRWRTDTAQIPLLPLLRPTGVKQTSILSTNSGRGYTQASRASASLSRFCLTTLSLPRQQEVRSLASEVTL